jgi:hypothetical protein
MAKMKMNLDWKKLMVEKGERVAVGACGVVCALMIVAMFWYLMFGVNSAKVAADLTKPTGELEKKFKAAQPSDADKPPKAKSDSERNVTFEKQRKVDEPEKYALNVLFTAPATQDANKRYKPEIFAPTAGTVAYTSVPVWTYIFTDGGKKVMVYKDKDAGGMSPMGQPMAPPTNDVAKMYGKKGGMPGGAPYPTRPGGGPAAQAPGYDSVGTESNKKVLDTIHIPVEQLSDGQNGSLVNTVQPLRMAIIVADFPYRKQVQEFQKKLNIKYPAEVFNDNSGEVDATGAPLASFRFVGVNVERRAVDEYGNPLKNEKGEDMPWEPVNYLADYKYWLYQNGKRFETDSAPVSAISFPGLVMQKFKGIDIKDLYPSEDNLEKSLPNIKETIDKMSKMSTANVQPPRNPFSVDGFDPLDPRGSTPAGTDTGTMPPMRERPPATTTPMPGADPSAQDIWLPDHCLIRLIDILNDRNVVPGRSYKYRIQVKMANPNYNVKNAASPLYANSKEPLVSEWFEINQIVKLPTEHHVYALDQAALDGKKYTDEKRQNYDLRTFDPERQTFFQIHKLLPDLRPDPKSTVEVPLGEWSVAERVPVFRGEYIGRVQRVEVAYWRFNQNSFVVAKDPALPKTSPVKGIPVDFNPSEGDVILVDFSGGRMTYPPPGAPKDVKTTPVSEAAGTEVLILSPDGRLLEHDSWVDRGNHDRETRLKAWHNRIKDIKDVQNGKKSTTDPMDPFKKGNS